MKIRIGLKSVNVDTNGICGRIRENRRFWTYAASEWHRLYAPYVPMDTGALTDTIHITPGEIEHNVPYARRQYYGTGFHFSKEKHPKATSRWDGKAAPEQGAKLARTLQKYIDRGGIHFQ